MAYLSDRQSVPANAVVANAMSGKTQEFIAENSIVRLYATGGAVGLFYTFIIGEEVVVEDQEVNAQNRMPLVPDDFVAEGGGFPGDRVVVKLRNSTGAAIVAFTRIEIEPA